MKLNFTKRLALPMLSLGVWSCCIGQAARQETETIIEAVRGGDSLKVIRLLDRGVDANFRGEHQYTPLIAAARYNHLDIARTLCDRGGDVDAVADIAELSGESGFTPLLWAASNCNVDMASLLMDRGATVGRPGAEGDTPLMIAARSNCLQLVKLFIEKGAAVDEIREYDRATALEEAVIQGHLDVADYLIGRGANFETRDKYGRSMLAQAASSGSLALVRYFLEKGLPVNGRDDYGKTAIFGALRQTYEGRYILQCLVEHGGDPTVKSKLGTTPLMHASLDGQAWQVGYLIEKGAAVNDADFRKETPLHYACRGIPDRLQPVFRGGRESEATIKLLLDKGAHVNVIDFNGKTPLMNAASNEAPRVIDLLLNHGAQVNAQDKKGWTALMHAADWDQTAVINVLVQRGADLNLRNAKGETALAVAKKYKHTARAYELLKSLGAKE